MLCGGSASSNADSATNALGKTTMGLGSLRAGGGPPALGCADKISLVCQGFVLQQAPSCADYCFDVRIRSCDLNGDLIMNLLDLSLFASYYPPQAYNKCGDFDCSGLVNLPDLSRFAFHYGPPGHKCF